MNTKTFLRYLLFTFASALLLCACSPAPGGTIIFSSDRENGVLDLYIMSLDTNETTRLIAEEAQRFAGPFSPDGDVIAFTGFGLTGSDIFTVLPDGTQLLNLSGNEAASNSFPAWSPDGETIVFSAWKMESGNDLYLVNTDGSGLVQLTSAPGDEWDADWDPQGKRLVFLSDRDNDPGVYDLYLMDVESGQVTRLTDDGINHYAPAWSPDGSWIAFRGHADGGAGEIYVIRPDGTGLKNLTGHPSEDWSPSWSPDGGQIVFQTNRDGNWEIYVMDADGGNVENLTQNAADDEWPFWGP